MPGRSVFAFGESGHGGIVRRTEENLCEADEVCGEFLLALGRKIPNFVVAGVDAEYLERSEGRSG